MLSRCYDTQFVLCFTIFPLSEPTSEHGRPYIYLFFSVFFHNFPHFSCTTTALNYCTYAHFHSNLQTFLLPLFALFIMNSSLHEMIQPNSILYFLFFFIGSRGNLKLYLLKVNCKLTVFTRSYYHCSTSIRVILMATESTFS